MQKFVLTCFLLNLAFIGIQCQEPCDPTLPLFEEVNPIWRHQIIDSTIIGYPDPDPSINFFYSGDDHLSFDLVGSFISGNFLYSITEIDITGDIAGALIEKIDLQTGELVWQISNDLRVSPYREKVLSVKAVDDVLVVSGIREEITNEASIPLQEKWFVGKSKGMIFERIYDLETGQQISFTTPSMGDSLAYSASFIPWVYYNFFDGDEIENFLDAKNFVSGDESFLIRRKIDKQGRLMAGPDTLVTGRFNGRLHNDAIRQGGPRLRKKENGNFLYVEQYSPLPGINHTFEAIISEYDPDFNLIRERDLKDFSLEEFSNIQILRTTADYILIRGCYDVENQLISNCESFCLILDHDLELIDRFDLVDAAGEQYQPGLYGLAVGGDGNYFVTDLDFMRDSVSTNHILTVNDQGILEVFQSFNGLNINQASGINHIDLLDNGDFLLRFRHSCLAEGVLGTVGSFQEWIRVDGAGFMTSISTVNNDFKYEVSPNPFTDYIEIDNVDGEITSVTILNLNGVIVKNTKVNGEENIRINTSDFESGFYFVSVINGNNQTSAVSIVKM